MNNLEEAVEKNFKFHHSKTKDMDEIRYLFRTLARALVKLCPNDTRELAISLTKLEECMFWTNAAISREENNG